MAVTGVTSTRVDRALTVWIIPSLSIVLVSLGGVLLQRHPGRDMAREPDLALALIAALSGILLAAWWFGGVLMFACAAASRRLGWRGLERWATRLTPKLIARTLGAVVGIHLVTLSAAQATEPVNPFWTGSETSVGQAGDQEPAAATPTDAPPPSETSSTADTPRSTDPTGVPSTPVTPALPETVQQLPSDPEASNDTSEPVSAPSRVVDSTLTVLRGDTLWDLTAQFLGPRATPAQIAEQTTTWLEHNELRNHGHLIHPGEQLQVPPHLLDSSSASLPIEGATS